MQPAVTLSIPNATQVNGPSQERQTIPVPRGNRYATLIRAQRNGVNGDLALSSGPLPDGVTTVPEPSTWISGALAVVVLSWRLLKSGKLKRGKAEEGKLVRRTAIM